MASPYRCFSDELGTEMVTLLVGPDKQKFVVHKNLLVSQSNYFKGALADNLFREAVEGIMTFEEDDPDAFRLLIDWVYRGHIPRVQPFIAKPDFSNYNKKEKKRGARAPPPRTPELTTRARFNFKVELPNPDDEEEKIKVTAKNLCAHSPYQSFSLEEIRLSDYQAAAVAKVPADPLRRDTGVASREDGLIKHSRLRKEWLGREVRASNRVPAVLQSPSDSEDSLHPPNKTLVVSQSPSPSSENGEAPVPDGEPSKKTNGTSSVTDETQKEKAVGHTPTDQTDNGAHPLDEASSNPEAQPSTAPMPAPTCEFTFHMKQPLQEDTQNGVPPKRGPLTCAATAVMADQMAKLRLSAAPVQAGKAGADPKKTSTSNGTFKQDKKPAGFPIELPPPRTAEAWAARVKEEAEAPPTAAAEAESTSPEASSDQQPQDTNPTSPNTGNSTGNNINTNTNTNSTNNNNPSPFPTTTSPSPPPSPSSEQDQTSLTTTHYLDFNSSSTPSPNTQFPTHSAATAASNAHQNSLLQLVALAEKLCWDRLFNAAMDAYLDGERLLNRRLVPLSHLQVAYTQCAASSPLRRFLADMVHFEARTCLTHERYLGFAGECADFLGDLFRRLDGKGERGGDGGRGNGGKKHPFGVGAASNPLRGRWCRYHLHEEWSGMGCF